MGKLAPDAMLDASLNYVCGGNKMTVCSGSPATYTDANTTLMLAQVAMTTGSITSASYLIEDDATGGLGRKVTTDAANGIYIATAGTAMAVAIVNTGDSTLRYVTTCTPQALVQGGTVDIPAWKIQIADPT